MPHSYVTAKFTCPGTHSWSDATGEREYLSHTHRHLFTCTVTVVVTHDDRQVEYHDLRDLILQWVMTYPLASGDMREFGNNSCEHLARDLWQNMVERNKLLVYEVSVSEDDEFTSTLSNRTANV